MRLLLCAVALGLLAYVPLASAADRSFKTASGVGIKVYDRTGTRMLRVSFDMRGMGSPDFDDSVSEMLKAMAEVAQAQSSEVFAVTNMYCSAPTLFGIDYVGCAIEGAWLKPGEMIATRPKDNKPVYFSTAAARAGTIPATWTKRLDLRDGLTGKVNIVPASAGSTIEVLGAVTNAN